jgi:hypothetical protein
MFMSNRIVIFFSTLQNKCPLFSKAVNIFSLRFVN